MATVNIAHVSEEEENYLRIELLLTGISPSAVRVLFDKEFHPSCLETSIKKEYNTLFDLKKKRSINTEQWKLLYPSGGNPKSTSFDVPLMITLLRNLAKLAPPTGGYDHLPLSTDTTPTADLARIKYYRNELAHNKTAKIKSEFFATAWEDISEAVTRLGGQNMKEECKELRKKRLDHSTVPWNIRGQICKIMDQWRVNDVNFVETTAAKQVLECVQEKSCVTITASSGVGKTATLQHVVLKMAAEGYDVLMITHPHDIVQFYNSNKKTLFVVDDFLGTYSINQSDLQNWKTMIKRIEELIKNNLTKIIVACRLQVYRDEQFESLSIFRTNVCNLSSEDLCLSHTEKKMIAEIYLEAEASVIIKYCDLFDCFPLLCKLYHDNPKLNVIDFFQNPYSVYESEIDQLKKNKFFGKYCALALCVMFNNKLNEEVLTDEIETETRIIIENTLEACRLDKGTSRLTLLDELDSLELTFIKKDQLEGVYKTVHDKIFDFLSYYFGKKMILCLVKNADSLLISQRFLLEKEEDMDQFITIVPPQYHQMYIQRMIKDWSNGYVVYLFLNKNMNNQTFRQRFLCYLNTLDILYQKQLAHKCDRYIKDTALLQCCCIGDIPLIQWCFYHCVDVDICRIGGVTPLIVSSAKGDTEVVKLLLDNKADINKCTDEEISPLFIACQKNYLDIVKILLDNKADINKCTDKEISPLCIACLNNYVDIVKLLLDNKADINKSTEDELSPLCLACQKNYVDIVKILLENKADINKCTDEESSPLFIACENNHVDIVKILLENKADINKCTDEEISPLCIACENNYVDIVKLLLDNKADINKCTDEEISPLYIACQNNHVEIVKLLLDKKVDINKCTDEEMSPLYIACQNNHVDIVKLLLDTNADVNKCRENEISPLLIACQNNHEAVVKLLLDSKADINKCTDNEISPLYIACQNNHINIVKLLLENKADINKCKDDEGSHLCIACQINHEEKANIKKCTNNELYPFTACMKGHVDVVNADINKCDINGTSPLLIASQENHVDVAKQLLDNKADINKCRSDGINPLLMACNKNHVEFVKLLLDNKADVNKCTNDEGSPLFFACRDNYVEIVKLLLDNKADVNKCTKFGSSPLLIACYKGNIDIVKILLAKGADYRLQGKLGSLGFLSPKQVASILEYNDIFDLICEHIRQNQCM